MTLKCTTLTWFYTLQLYFTKSHKQSHPPLDRPTRDTVGLSPHVALVEGGVALSQMAVQVAQPFRSIHDHVHVNQLSSGIRAQTQQPAPSPLRCNSLDDDLRRLDARSGRHLRLEGRLDAASVAGEAGEAGVECDGGCDLLGVGALEALRAPAAEERRAALHGGGVGGAYLDRRGIDTERTCSAERAVSGASNCEGVLTNVTAQAKRAVGSPGRRIVRARHALGRVDRLDRAVVTHRALGAVLL